MIVMFQLLHLAQGQISQRCRSNRGQDSLKCVSSPQQPSSERPEYFLFPVKSKLHSHHFLNSWLLSALKSFQWVTQKLSDPEVLVSTRSGIWELMVHLWKLEFVVFKVKNPGFVKLLGYNVAIKLDSIPKVALGLIIVYIFTEQTEFFCVACLIHVLQLSGWAAIWAGTCNIHKLIFQVSRATCHQEALNLSKMIDLQWIGSVDSFLSQQGQFLWLVLFQFLCYANWWLVLVW